MLAVNMGVPYLASSLPFPLFVPYPLIGNAHNIKQLQNLDFSKQSQFHMIFSYYLHKPQKSPRNSKKKEKKISPLCLISRRDIRVLYKILIFFSSGNFITF